MFAKDYLLNKRESSKTRYNDYLQKFGNSLAQLIQEEKSSERSSQLSKLSELKNDYSSRFANLSNTITSLDKISAETKAELINADAIGIKISENLAALNAEYTKIEQSTGTALESKSTTTTSLLIILTLIATAISIFLANLIGKKSQNHLIWLLLKQKSFVT